VAFGRPVAHVRPLKFGPAERRRTVGGLSKRIEDGVPEGHTIHRMARQHRQWLSGQSVSVTSPQGRLASAPELDGRRLVATDAFGKHLFHRYDDHRSVHIHLGLFGKFFVHEGTPPPPRDTVQYRAGAGGRTIDLIGATTCELVTPDEVGAIIGRLGPDPLRRDADPDLAWRALQRRNVGIGRALMDQGVLAGVGNVFRAEVLFVAGMHPETPSREVARPQFDAMWDQLVQWLRWGTRTGRIVTMDPTEVGAATRGRIRDADRTYVYKQETCRRCRSPIRRWDLAGRWAYACESCQVPVPTS